MTPLGSQPGDGLRWSAEDLGILNHFLVDSPVAGANRAPSSLQITPAACNNSAATVAGVVSPLAANQARAGIALTALAASSASDRVIVRAGARNAQTEVLSKEERLRRKYQRRYKRRVGRMQDLRDQVASLEALLATLSLENGDRTDTSSYLSDALNDVEAEAEQLERALATRSRSTGSQATGPFGRDVLGTAPARVAALRMRLQQENALLRRLFHQSTRRLQVVREVFHSHHQPYVVVNGNRSFVLVKPLTVAECNEIRRAAMDEFRVFSTNEQYVRLTATTCGWKERRVVENGVVNYALKKTFFNQAADFLAGLSWRLLTDPVLMESVYSASLQMDCHIVQRVDDDNFVILQEYVVDGSLNVKSLYLVSREANEWGHVQVIRGLGSERLEFLDDPAAPLPSSASHLSGATEIWNDVFMWCQQAFHGDKKEHTVNTISGVTPLVGSDSRFWVTEIMLEVIRCEQICFGPRFSLPPSE